MAVGYLCAIATCAATTLTTGLGAASLLDHSEPQNIVEIAAGNADFETLVSALTAAELVDDIRDATNITVLAPTDAAFAALDQTALNNTIRQNPTGRLADVLKFHVIPERLTAAQLANRRFVNTLDGQRLEIKTSAGLTIGGSGVAAADIEADNGIIHVIDTVLIPAKANIAEVATEAGQFTTLLAAAEAAGLVDTLVGAGPLTVFAPTDEAFAKLGEATMASLLDPENRGTLTDILTYHVVTDRVYANDLLASGSVETATGEALAAEIRDGQAFINDSRIVATDLDASNGVVHVIDAVLIPSNSSSDTAARPTTGSVEGVFALAIERGVPLFNQHQQAACAAIYEVAIVSALALDTGLTDRERGVLELALDRGRSERDAAERAWMFRRGMDNLLRDAQGAMERTANRNSH
ncbi:MAG: fasciclin domain-containing protein [Planctomycetota bacterium]